MKLSTTKTLAVTLSLLGAFSIAGAVHANGYTVQSGASDYVTQSNNSDEESTGTKINLVDTTANTDFDVINFTTNGTVSDAASIDLALTQDAAGTYGVNGSGTGAGTSGTVDFYIVAPAAQATITGTKKYSWSSSSVLPAETSFATDESQTTTLGTGQGVGNASGSLYGFQGSTPSGTLTSSDFMGVGQSYLAVGNGTSTLNFDFNVGSGSALQTYLDGLASGSTVQLIVADDSTDGGITGATADSFFGGGGTSNNPTLTVNGGVAPAPEASSVISMAVVLALLGGMTFFGMKRRTSKTS